jgi:hypothetical protein
VNVIDVVPALKRITLGAATPDHIPMRQDPEKSPKMH